jgi:pimeloyl-ACP methyl ester carboxylesterase
MTWRCWGSGPPLLFIHGSHGSWSHWIRNIDAFIATRTVCAMDLPAYGDSAMPPQEDHAAIVDVIAAGLRTIFGEERAIDTVGFSFGGLMAAYLSAFHPASVRRLILAATGGLGTPLGSTYLRRVRGLEGDERRAAVRENLLGLMLHHAESADDLAVHIHDINTSRGRMRVGPLVLPDKLFEILPKVTVPVDAIWGECDRPHPDPGLQERALRQRKPQLEFKVIRDAGHWVMYERAEEFNQALIELLAIRR